MNDIAENLNDRIAMRRLGTVIVAMCGLTVVLITAATLVGTLL